MVKALLLATALFVVPYAEVPIVGETLDKEKYYE